MGDGDVGIAALLARAGIGLAEVDADDGRFVEVDPTFCALVGRPADELRGLTAAAITHPGDVERTTAILVALRAGTSNGATLEHRYLRRDGAEVWARVTLARAPAERSTVQLLAEPCPRPPAAAPLPGGLDPSLAAVIRTSLTGIAVMRLSDSAILEANETLTARLGWRRDEVLGRTTDDLQIYPDPATRAQLDHDFVVDGTLHQRAVTVRHRSGALLDFQISAGPVELGGERCAIAFWEDVTEAKRMHAALRASEDEFRAMFEVAPVGLVQTRLSTRRILRVNAALCELTGYRADELIGSSIDTLTHPDDRADDADVISRVQRGEAAIVHHAKRYVRKDGRVVWVEITARTLTDGARPNDVTMAVVVDVTDRRRSEELVRLQTSALQAADTGIAITDVAGTVQWVNAAFSRLTGYPADEVVGQNPRVLKSGEHPPDFYRDLWATITAGRTWHGEVVNRRRDGQRYDEEMTINPVRDAAGAVTHFVAIKRDVTDRKRTAEALREAEERYRLALDATEVGTWRHDLAANSFHLDRRAQEHLGLVRSVATMAEMLAPIHVEDLPGIRAMIGSFYAPGGPERARFEARVVRPSGEVRWLAVHVQVSYVHEGDRRRARFAIATSRDVTEARLAADALRASEDRYRALVDNLDAIVFTVDRQGRLTFVNQAVARFGYQPADVLGRNIGDFVHPDDRASIGRDMVERLAGHERPPVECRWIDATGKVLIMRTSTGPLLVDGHLIGLTGLSNDVTHQRATEDQLRVAQRMEAVGRLAGGVAHDFNNMLSVILSYSELMMDELEPDSALRELVREVIEASMRAAGLTRQLLAFSRRQLLQPEAVQLGELVAGLTKMLRRLIGEDVALAVDVDADAFTIKVDRGQLEQVLMNLAVNARDAMPDGGELKITVSNRTLTGARAAPLELAPGDYVEVAVTDTGVGMPPEVQARIFEPFFTTKPVGKGTGLGLATVHGIVKQSGAGIIVQSAPGSGTRFELLFPRLIEAAPTSVEPIRPAPGPVGGREWILVVEDEVALRHVVERVLTMAGYHVLVAADPEHALRLGHEHGRRLALVLTDVVMPGMNGRVLAERLTPLCPHARVMFMSGYNDDMIAHHDVLGASFIRKPFDRAALAAKVRSVLDAAAPS